MPDAATDDTPPLCAHCGLAEDEHHAFTPIEMPPGCKCDPTNWYPTTIEEGVPNVCTAYVLDADTGHCGECEHDEPCHAKPEATT
jgi:hypothetical protein